MYGLITFLDNFLRGKNYFGDFIKTLIIGFLFYVVGFILIILKILIFTSISFLLIITLIKISSWWCVNTNNLILKNISISNTKIIENEEFYNLNE